MFGEPHEEEKVPYDQLPYNQQDLSLEIDSEDQIIENYNIKSLQKIKSMNYIKNIKESEVEDNELSELKILIINDEQFILEMIGE